MSEQNHAHHEPGPTGSLPGEPGRRWELREHHGHRVLTRSLAWLTWWVLMMSLWVAADDSLQSDELLAGAGAAALAALAAEVVTYQAAIRLRVRPRWLVAGLWLPGEVLRDTWLVFGALARMLLRREPPHGGFAELPVRYGDSTPLGGTRRVLLTGACSLAPNTFVLGLDAERDVMVVHELVGDGVRT